MSRFIIKPDAARDLYVEWSTIVESPTFWGTREEMTDHLRGADGSANISDRLQRADQYGTSEPSIREGGRNDSGLIYEQRGWLPRRLIADACVALERDDETAVWAMLEPFDDEDGA